MQVPNKLNYMVGGILLMLLVFIPAPSFGETTEVGSVVISDYLVACGDGHFSDKQNQQLCLQTVLIIFLMICLVTVFIISILVLKIKSLRIAIW